MRYIIFAILLIISGCSNKQKPIEEYTILSQNELSSSSKKSNKSLAISPIKTPKYIMAKELIYLYSNGSMGSYAYSRWSESPALMLERLIFEKLYNYQLFSSITPSTSMSKADYILESNLDKFFHYIDDEKSYGVIKIDCRLIDISQKKVISQKEFNIKIASDKIDATSGIKALQLGTNKIADEIILWLEKGV